MFLHPQNSTEIFIDLAGLMTLATASKQFSQLRLLQAAENKLIISASAGDAGSTAYVSANGSRFSLLLEHKLLPS